MIEIQNSEKECFAEMLDKDFIYGLSGEIKEVKPKEIPPYEKIKQVLHSFLRNIKETLLPHFAIKIKEKQLCDLIQKGVIFLR